MGNYKKLILLYSDCNYAFCLLSAWFKRLIHLKKKISGKASIIVHLAYNSKSCFLYNLEANALKRIPCLYFLAQIDKNVILW